MKENSVTVVRRDTGEKMTLPKAELSKEAPRLLKEIQQSLYEQAKTFRNENTYSVESYDEFKSIIADTSGFVKCGWDGDPDTEAAIQEETKATIRCIPFEQEVDGLTCVYSGKPAKHEVIFGKAY
jgi:prolyl-tRNA synthetase